MSNQYHLLTALRIYSSEISLPYNHDNEFPSVTKDHLNSTLNVSMPMEQLERVVPYKCKTHLKETKTPIQHRTADADCPHLQRRRINTDDNNDEQ